MPSLQFYTVQSWLKQLQKYPRSCIHDWSLHKHKNKNPNPHQHYEQAYLFVFESVLPDLLWTPGCPGTHCVNQVGHNLWDRNHSDTVTVLIFLCGVLGIEPWDLVLVRQRLTTESHPVMLTLLTWEDLKPLRKGSSGLICEQVSGGSPDCRWHRPTDWARKKWRERVSTAILFPDCRHNSASCFPLLLSWLPCQRLHTPTVSQTKSILP